MHAYKTSSKNRGTWLDRNSEDVIQSVLEGLICVLYCSRFRKVAGNAGRD